MALNKGWLTAAFCCSLGLSNCTSTPDKATPLGFHDYSLEVEDTSPMGGVQSAFKVSIPDAWVRQQGQPTSYATLYHYSRYYTVEQPKGWMPRTRQVPMDTVRMALSRAYVDTIYQMTRGVFAIAASPELYNLKYPLQPSSHDLDNYLIVRFSQPAYGGPTMQCSGYEEYNWAAYSLAKYLHRLKARLLPAHKN
ncbi:hypothetical protein [Hymenobacter chitinivorans]|uniref:Uncharacterized protein n=1 Tax=Hymenobacter chitinivorans DSM 11115 TaxID=1121954 RepID=A0A2M9B4P4_9BACT|nr:hypothetical protein [Hymenobacter chitinivorans]PJJ52909.1 hypothetical protein CLV45_3566 [Hymenobacter chitinivorans DSM 11115]